MRLVVAALWCEIKNRPLLLTGREEKNSIFQINKIVQVLQDTCLKGLLIVMTILFYFEGENEERDQGEQGQAEEAALLAR